AVLRRLEADREARDAEVGEAGQAVGVERQRVGLERRLQAAGPAEGVPQGREHALQLVVAQVRGRAAAEVERVEGPAVPLAQRRELARERVDVAARQPLVPEHLVEVAVGADAGAEGDVDVERGERHARRGYPARAPAPVARGSAGRAPLSPVARGSAGGAGPGRPARPKRGAAPGKAPPLVT